MTLIEYIKASVEILMSMNKDEDNSCNGDLKNQAKINLKKQAQHPSKKNFDSLENSPSNGDETSRHVYQGFDGAQQQDLINEYEQMIQKLEGDIRNHIRIEQQLKLHIESIQNKLEELERTPPQDPQKNQKAQDQLEMMKRDKRRMDELITMKENQYLNLQEQFEGNNKKLLKSEEQCQV